MQRRGPCISKRESEREREREREGEKERVKDLCLIPGIFIHGKWDTDYIVHRTRT